MKRGGTVLPEPETSFHQFCYPRQSEREGRVAYRGWEESNVNGNFLALVEDALVGLDDVVARGGGFNFVSHVVLGGVVNRQVCF